VVVFPADFLGEAQFDVTMLPARVGYLIAPGSKHGFYRAIQEACSRWGGVTEPIISVRKSGRPSAWDRQLVETSRIDGLVLVDADPDAAAAVARSLGLSITPINLIDRSGRSQWSTFPGALYEGERRQSLLLPADDSLWQATAIGSLQAGPINTYERLGCAVGQARTDDEVARLQFMGTSLLDATAAEFGEYSASDGPWPSPAILWIASKDAVDSCRDFWNLRALRSLVFERQSMVLIPAVGPTNWVGFDDLFRGMLERQTATIPDVAIMGPGITPKRLTEVAEWLGLHATADLKISQVFGQLETRKAPFTYRADLDVRAFFVNGRKYGARAETKARLFRSGTELDFVSPVKMKRQGSGRALFRLESLAFEVYPRRASVAEHLVRNAEWADDALQIAVSIRQKHKLQILLPSLEEILGRILAERSVTYKPSDKGVRAAAFASMDSVELIFRSGVFELVRALTTPRAKELVAAVSAARRNGDSDVAITELISDFGGRRKRLHLSVAQIRSKTPNVAVSDIEDLACSDWLERGFVVKCPRCRITSFVSLNHTTTAGLCPACGTGAGYQCDKCGPIIFYRLAAILDHASDQGVLPQAMVALRVSQIDSSSYVIPGADLTFPDGTTGDADVLGIFQRKLIVGEVKTSATGFNQAELAKNVRRAKSAGADVLLLGCIQPIPAAITESATRLATRAALDLLVVNALETLNRQPRPDEPNTKEPGSGL
jgi:hypothetical protein